MTTRYIYNKVYVLLALTTLTTACTSYDDEPFTGESLPRAAGYTTGTTNDWLYLDLATGRTYNADAPGTDIAEGEQAGRTDWDIAFCGPAIRTNSGTSGTGHGGAADLGQISYAKLQRLPEDIAWAVDDSTVQTTISRADWNRRLLAEGKDFDLYPWFDPNAGPATEPTSANPVLSRAITFAAPPPTYTPTMHTYALRAADGRRIYKLQIVSWYHPDAQPGDAGGRLSYYLQQLAPQ